MALISYREFRLHPLLIPFVKVIYSMENSDVNAGPIRILPDACVELVFHLREPYFTKFPDSRISIQPQSFLVGQMRRWIEIQPAGKSCFIAARFSAWGAYHFFPFPMNEVENDIVDTQGIAKELFAEISNRIGGLTDGERQSECLQQWLISQLGKNSKHDWSVDYCLKLLYQSHGGISVEQLSRITGMSPRHLLRKFEARIGISPKQLASILRLHRSLKRMRSSSSESLAGLAVDCGFYDQAHFTRQFREYTGFTPTEYLENPENLVY